MRKVAFVAGGAGGIGRAIAHRFANSGTHVVATGRTLAEIEKAQQWDSDGRIDWRVLDIRDADAIDAACEGLDRLDALVNAAGMLVRDGREFNPDTFDDVIAVNLSGALRLCTRLKPALQEAGGAIVLISSMLAYFGSGHQPAYSASKGGVSQLTKSLAIAWAKDGVRVNAIAPGWIETELTAALFDDAARSERILTRTPLARWGRPDDVSGAVIFLTSDDARFITGATLAVDGGYSIA